MSFSTWPPTPESASPTTLVEGRIEELESTLETLVLNQLEET